MCRMIGLVGPPVSPEGEVTAGLPSWEHLVAAAHSLRRQAHLGAVPPGAPVGHEDSWGIGWFDAAGQVSLVRQTGSAIDSASYVFAAELAARSNAGSGPAATLIGHLRKASCGAVTSENAHPVRIDPRRRVGGDIALIAHNGTVHAPLLESMRADIRDAGRGEADSDSDTVVLAAWLAHHSATARAENRLEALRDAIFELLERADTIGPTDAYSAMNLLIAFPEGLYALRQCSKNADYYTLYARPLGETPGWVVASERTDDHADWRLLEIGDITFFPADGGVVRAASAPSARQKVALS